MTSCCRGRDLVQHCYSACFCLLLLAAAIDLANAQQLSKPTALLVPIVSCPRLAAVPGRPSQISKRAPQIAIQIAQIDHVRHCPTIFQRDQSKSRLHSHWDDKDRDTASGCGAPSTCKFPLKAATIKNHGIPIPIAQSHRRHLTHEASPCHPKPSKVMDS